MRAARPSELKEQAIPVFAADVSETELRRWVPVTFKEISDPLEVPEPSLGTLIKLTAGQFAVLVYGRNSRRLIVRFPASADFKAELQSFFEDIPLPQNRITWYAAGFPRRRSAAVRTSPRSVAAAKRAVSRFKTATAKSVGRRRSSARSLAKKK